MKRQDSLGGCRQFGAGIAIRSSSFCRFDGFAITRTWNHRQGLGAQQPCATMATASPAVRRAMDLDRWAGRAERLSGVRDREFCHAEPGPFEDREERPAIPDQEALADLWRLRLWLTSVEGSDRRKAEVSGEVCGLERLHQGFWWSSVHNRPRSGSVLQRACRSCDVHVRAAYGDGTEGVWRQFPLRDWRRSPPQPAPRDILGRKALPMMSNSSVVATSEATMRSPR